jgi:hypothetical protein
MPTLSSNAPAYTTPPPKRDGADFEPDDEWKRKLKEGIEHRFKYKIQEARDNQQAQLMEGNVSPERLDVEYKEALHNIKGLAEDQYQLALKAERIERIWIAGVQMLPGRSDQSSIDDRGTNRPLPSSSAASTPRYQRSEPRSYNPSPTREAPTGDRLWSRTLTLSSSTDGRRHDNNAQRNLSRDREDQAPSPSRLRRHNTDQHQPTLSENLPACIQDPEEQHRPSSRPCSGRPRSNSEKPWDFSMGRSSASIPSASSADRHRFGRLPPPTPPIQNPDRRRLSSASQKDPPLPPATKYQIGRRASPASIRSTGSGHSDRSIRHLTTEMIPERADDVEESPSSSAVKEWLRKSTADDPPATKYQIGRRGSRASIRSMGSGHSDRSIRHPTTEMIPKRANDVEESPFSPTVKERLRNSTADNPPATKYQIGRRGSRASIRSTGSGHSDRSIRHPTTERIPERADDMEESPFSFTVKERLRKSAADNPPRDKDSRRGSRRDSQPIPVDASIMNRYDHWHEAPLRSSLRSAPGPSSTTMQYARSASSSFVEDRFHHPLERDRPLKSSRPYLDSEPPYHSREVPKYTPFDMPPSARPGSAPPPRPSPYVEERDFVGPFPPLVRPPAPPFSGERESLRDGGRDRDRESLRERERNREREREYHRSISHKSSFSSYDERWRRERERDWEQWDEDREARERDSRDRDRDREYWELRERERGGRDWDHPRERDRRERERDRDRELYREREYAHSRGYPTPPSSASRLAQPHVGSIGDYLPVQEIYNDGAVPPSSAAAAARGSYGSYRGGVPSPTGMHDDWDYPPRPESGRPSIPTRQPSYGRRESERRGTIVGGGLPELGSCHSSLSYSSLLSNQKKTKKRRRTLLLTTLLFYFILFSYRWLYTVICACISTLTRWKYTHPTSSTFQRGDHRRRTTTRMADLACRERTAPPPSFITIHPRRVL